MEQAQHTIRKPYEVAPIREQPNGSYKEEFLNLNEKVAEVWDDFTEEIPMDYIQQNKKKFGELSQISLNDPVRNTVWRFLKFNNSDVFRPAAIDYKRSEKEREKYKLEPVYCDAPKDSMEYYDYWKTQQERCLKGYEPIVDGKPCGVRISGEYYFYLNFCRIKLAAKDKVTGQDTEIEDFPKFTSMDYYWFKELELRENPGIFFDDEMLKKKLTRGSKVY